VTSRARLHRDVPHPSTAKNGAISSIVPMVSHVDHTEHDVHVVITEWGVADLRGLAPRRRAQRIIDNCAHPDYRPMFAGLFRARERHGARKHTPHFNRRGALVAARATYARAPCDPYETRATRLNLSEGAGLKRMASTRGHAKSSCPPSIHGVRYSVHLDHFAVWPDQST